MADQNPYRWHILLSLGFFLGITMVFFAVATRPEKKIEIETVETPELTTPTVSFIDPQVGAEAPIITIVEFADFTCEACVEASTNLARLLNTYPDEVRIVWKDFPNESKSPEATPAAVAARCAAEQNAFWQYHDELFLRQNQLGSDTYTAIAEALGLNTRTFESCVASSDTLPACAKTLKKAWPSKLPPPPPCSLTAPATSAQSVTKT